MSTFVRFETSSLWQAEGLSMDPHSKLNALAVTVSIPQARSPTGGKSGQCFVFLLHVCVLSSSFSQGIRNPCQAHFRTWRIVRCY